ncbi:MAG TPA: hypothetical protein PLT47_00750 [Bacteroidales bacterium]|nr:hypothetical protein [Bacteroidales bacterium]HQI69247.1 hypothetical protein [Bacteroidales bacterium]
MPNSVQQGTVKILMFITIVFLTVLYSCYNNKPKPGNNNASQLSAKNGIIANTDSLLFELTDQILSAMQAKDYAKISSFFHPVSGVRFSPYAYIDTVANVTLTREPFNELVNQQIKLKWGSFNGSGEDILMTVQQYFNRFVYNANYLKNSKKSLNNIIGKGNTLNNIRIIYKDYDFIECYIPGSDKKSEGMDWCSLRLVYKKFGDQYFLVGLIHDQWTI